MRYLLDTDICIHLRRRLPPVVARFAKLDPSDMGISMVSYGELLYGAKKSADPTSAVALIQQLVTLVPVLPLPERAGLVYGSIRFDLAERGNIIGPNDLWLAAHAIASDLVLVTNNEREFRRVKGLKIENWAR